MNKQYVVRLCYMCNCRDFSKKKRKPCGGVLYVCVCVIIMLYVCVIFVLY